MTNRNWRYGLVRDSDGRLHPKLIRFREGKPVEMEQVFWQDEFHGRDAEKIISSIRGLLGDVQAWTIIEDME